MLYEVITLLGKEELIKAFWEYPEIVENTQKLLDLPEASEQDYAQVEGTWELAQDTSGPAT